MTTTVGQGRETCYDIIIFETTDSAASIESFTRPAIEGNGLQSMNQNYKVVRCADVPYHDTIQVLFPKFD